MRPMLVRASGGVTSSAVSDRYRDRVVFCFESGDVTGGLSSVTYRYDT